MNREPRLRDRRFPDGSEGAVLDTSPIHVSTSPRAKAGLRSQIREAIQVHELGRLLAEEEGYRETFEESNDFDIGDDYSSEDDFDSDLDPPQEVLDSHDELDVRLADSLRRVFESFGMRISPEDASAPASDSGGKGGDTPGPAGESPPTKPAED